VKIEETFAVPAPVERVWEFVADPEKMASCLPAVQSVEVKDDRHYEVIVKQKVGVISATFRIATEILEREAPHRMVLENRGKTIAGAKGMMKSTDTILLKATPDGTTEVQVTSELMLGGQLAVLGAKLIEAKSKEIFAEATANLKGKLGVAPDPGPETEEKPGRMARLKGMLQRQKNHGAETV
jgi:carbon monoxide dehydrogenase subunit G